MIAYQGDIAVACVVQGGNFGDLSAGPAVAAMLTAAGRWARDRPLEQLLNAD